MSPNFEDKKKFLFKTGSPWGLICLPTWVSFSKCNTLNLRLLRNSQFKKQRILHAHGSAEIRNFSSSVEKYFTSERSEQVEYFFNTRREILYLQAAMKCSIKFYYINTSEIPNHFTLIVFWCERCDLLCSHSKGDIFTCEDNMLFSHVKISSFRAKAHLVFHWCLHNKTFYFMSCFFLK